MKRCIDCGGIGEIEINDKLLICPTCGGMGMITTNKFCGSKIFTKVPYLYILHSVYLHDKRTKFEIINSLMELIDIPMPGYLYDKINELENYGYIKKIGVDKYKEPVFALTERGTIAYKINIDRLICIFNLKNKQ